MNLPTNNPAGMRCRASLTPATETLAAARLASLGMDGRAAARPYRRGERGSATILVFGLVAILVLYMNGNQLALHSAKRELRLLEQKQLKKFQAPAKSAPAARP